jgi:signal transduction histidine kinase
MVSHELKAPLSSLLMQISVVRDGLAGELTTKQTELLGKAKDKTKGMITLVNDLLDYRRINFGADCRVDASVGERQRSIHRNGYCFGIACFQWR